MLQKSIRVAEKVVAGIDRTVEIAIRLAEDGSWILSGSRSKGDIEQICSTLVLAAPFAMLGDVGSRNIFSTMGAGSHDKGENGEHKEINFLFYVQAVRG